MLLSIIIPCYNSEKFIANTLNLLLSQGLNDCEVIVINDGSTDNTSKIVHKITEENKNIKIFDKKNEGVSNARNYGLSVATGEFIYFLDSDDALETNTLKYFRMILNNKSSIFFAFGYYSKDEKGKIKNYYYPKIDNKILNSEQIKKLFLLKKLNFHVCSCIYKRKFLIDNKIVFLPNIAIGEDIVFLLNVIKKADECFYSSRKCYIYQIRTDSVMGGYRFKIFNKKNLLSYELRKEKAFELFSKEDKLNKYLNFWICVQYISHYFMYLKSVTKDKNITSVFIRDCSLFKQKVKFSFSINYFAIIIFKVFPKSFLLKLLKGERR